jgi:hypothetical protein
MSQYKELIDAAAGLASDKLEEVIRDGVAKMRASSKDLKEPWQKSVVFILAISLEREGIKGLEKAERCLKNLLHGKTANLSDLPLLARSEALMMMQKTEAAERSAAAAYISVAGNLISGILTASIKGLVL